MLVNIMAFVIGCIVSALIFFLSKRKNSEDSKGTLYILCSDDGEVYAMGEFYSDPANLSDGEMIVMECKKIAEKPYSRKDQTL